jgi:hypothetical protein
MTVELNRKAKGDMAELAVATDLRRRGHLIAIPFGEDWDFDLVVRRRGTDRLERVQVKHAQTDGRVIAVKCTSHSLTNGRVRATKRYTAAMIDWLAAFDPRTGRCYYIPASMLGEGRSAIYLRLVGTRNGQSALINWAKDYEDF